MTLTEEDAVDASAGLGRTFSSYDAATLTGDSAGEFGAGWQSDTMLASSDVASDDLTDNRSTDGTVLVSFASGGSQTFTPETGSTAILRPVEPSGDDTKLTFTAGSGSTPDAFELSTPMGSATTTTTWTLQPSDTGGDPAWVVASTDNPGTSQDQTLANDHQRLTWIEQSEPGASSNCTATVQSVGCRGLKINYTGTGAATRVTSVSNVFYAQGTSAPGETTIAAYSYNTDGTLAQVCGSDPDGNPNTGDPALCSNYSYITQGGRTLLATATPPGQKPWRFSYGGSGQLTTVKRERPADDPTGGDAVWSVDYSLIPTSTGLPDMSSSAIAQWGQSQAPEYVYAVYAPHAGTLDVTEATLYYTGADGVVSNTAQYGSEGWLVDTTWRDAQANIVQSLDGAAWAHVMDTAAADRPAMAQQLSSYKIFNTWGDAAVIGTRVMDEYGPAHTATLNDGTTGLFRTHTAHLYDDDPAVPAALTSGRSGVATGIEVQQTTSVSDAERTTDYDNQTVRYDYNAIVTGDGDGWALGTPTRVLTQSGPNVGTGLGAGDWSIAVNRFDTDGRTIEIRQPGGSASGSRAGSDAHSTTISYYTATGTGDCGGKADWAGLVCKTGPAAQPTGPGIPVIWTHDYDTDLQPTVVREESAGGTVRTTTTGYDALGRPEQSIKETTGSGVANEAITTSYGYDANQGAQTAVTVSGKTIATRLDSWGRTINYTDALGTQSATSYAADGQVKTAGDSAGTYAFGYDSHGILASVDAGGGVGTFIYSWTRSGALDQVTYPNGVIATRTYDQTDATATLNYTQGGTDLLEFTNTLDARGRTLAATSTASNQQYTYDRLDRLVTTQDTRDTGCTTRTYGFNDSSDRTDYNTYAPNTTDDSCQTTVAQTTTLNTFDTAGRIRNTGYNYDTLGRTTTTPQADSAPGAQGDLTATYHADDMVASLGQSVSNTAGGTDAVLMGYGLDPAERINTVTTTTNGGETSRLRYRFADGSDSPAIVDSSTDAGSSWTSTRYVSLPALNLAASVSSGGVSVQLTNPHGDVIATMPNTSGADGITTYTETDEYGNLPSSGGSAARYGWLGTHQRSDDALGGLTLMGARLYNPSTGAFLSVDPVRGGNATSYNYPDDPINSADLDGRYGYLYYYPLGFHPLTSATTLFKRIKNNITGIFTFPNNCTPLVAGLRCTLYSGKKSPVEVSYVSDHSFTFLSLPGHPEGAGKHIRFSVFRRAGYMFLRVHAWGPDVTWCDKHSACKTANRVAAFGLWSQFAVNIVANLF